MKGATVVLAAAVLSACAHSTARTALPLIATSPCQPLSDSFQLVLTDLGQIYSASIPGALDGTAPQVRTAINDVDAAASAAQSASKADLFSAYGGVAGALENPPVSALTLSRPQTLLITAWHQSGC